MQDKLVQSILVLLTATSLALVGCDGGGGGDSGSSDSPRSEEIQLAEMTPLGFPFEDPSKATQLGAFGCPDWNGPGRPHPGLDVSTYGRRGYDRVRLVSPAAGTVSRIEFQDSDMHGVMPMIWIQIDESLTCSITIEPGTTDPDVVAQQRQAVYVSVGQAVVPGDFIAELVIDETDANGGGIHMDLQSGNNHMLCPYHHSSDAAKAIYDSIEDYNMGEVCSSPCYVEELYMEW